MKQKNLYIILALCLIIIVILITYLITSHHYEKSQEQHYLENTDKSNKNIVINNRNYPDYPNYHSYGDVDYAYDYDGYWFQPSRWWNNLWHNRRWNMHNIHNRRYNYDRHDGLDTHNRYINNSIHINQPHNHPHNPNSQSGPNLHSNIIHPIHKESSTNQQHQYQSDSIPIPNTNPNSNPNSNSNPNNNPIISLVKPEIGSDFQLPKLSSFSSSPVMPEDVAISPMTNMLSSENVVQTISTFTSDMSGSYTSPFTSGYVSNFDYKGPDTKNHKPYPMDMMASESIYLQPNTAANRIIVPPIVMEHPNPM